MPQIMDSQTNDEKLNKSISLNGISNKKCKSIGQLTLDFLAYAWTTSHYSHDISLMATRHFLI